MNLQHRLRDVEQNAAAVGMKLNVKKTNMIVFNPKHSRQVIPFVALDDGNPLPCVKTMRLLGIIIDEDL